MDDIKWLIGAIVAVVGMLGGLIARDRQVMQKIEDGDSKVLAKLERMQADHIATERNLVKKDDLKDYLQSIERQMSLMREEQRDLTKAVLSSRHYGARHETDR